MYTESFKVAIVDWKDIFTPMEKNMLTQIGNDKGKSLIGTVT